MQEKLEEIVWLRAVATICIVIGHCFGMYENWIPINEYIHGIYYKIYDGINPFLIYLALPLFVFISGYLMAHSKKEEHFKKFLIKKTIRLLLPGIIFSFLYYLLFKTNSSDSIISVIINLLINGYGHLWFLYMLFGVYIIGWIHIKCIKPKGLIINIFLSFILSFIFMFCNIPRGIGQIFFYYFFFYIGVASYIHKSQLLKIFSNIKPFIFILIYVVAFLIFSSIKLWSSPKIDNIVLISFSHWLYRFIMGFVGISTIFLFSILKKIYISIIINNISLNSFLIYILHQFILIGLLTFNNIKSIFQLSPVFFLFILTLAVLLISYILSNILNKNKYVQKYL